MKRIVYTRPDGGVSVVHPCININEAITEQEAFDRAYKALPIDAINPTAVDESEVPSDRSFRDAWTHDGKAFGVDIAKAQGITKDRLRRERAPLLSALDVAYAKADEAGDTVAKKDIAAKKQALRDVTKQVDAISDTGILKSLTVEVNQ